MAGTTGMMLLAPFSPADPPGLAQRQRAVRQIDPVVRAGGESGQVAGRLLARLVLADREHGGGQRDHRDQQRPGVPQRAAPDGPGGEREDDPAAFRRAAVGEPGRRAAAFAGSARCRRARRARAPRPAPGRGSAGRWPDAQRDAGMREFPAGRGGEGDERQVGARPAGRADGALPAAHGGDAERRDGGADRGEQQDGQAARRDRQRQQPEDRGEAVPPARRAASANAPGRPPAARRAIPRATGPMITAGATISVLSAAPSRTSWRSAPPLARSSAVSARRSPDSARAIKVSVATLSTSSSSRPISSSEREMSTAADSRASRAGKRGRRYRVAGHRGRGQLAESRVQSHAQLLQPGRGDAGARAGYRYPVGERGRKRPGPHRRGAGEQRAVGGVAACLLNPLAAQRVEVPVRAGRVIGPEDAAHPQRRVLAVVGGPDGDDLSCGHAQPGGRRAETATGTGPPAAAAAASGR